MTDPLRRAGAAPEPSAEITVDGRPVRVLPGQTLAAAMLAARGPGWRGTRGSGEERGLFCGIGVCFDCLVTVNGVGSVRACLVTVRPGDVVSTERGPGHADRAV